MYTHPVIAPWLRENFGYHAAYLMGNYLFGTSKPETKCVLNDGSTAVEGFIFENDKDMMQPKEFKKLLPRCGLSADKSVLVTNDPTSVSGYKAVVKQTEDNAKGQVCAFRKLTSAVRIVHTFGSRFGFWATALQGSPGGFMNGIDRICVNMTNSQQGSLWHTYCPAEKAGYIFRTNSRLYVCASHVNDIKRYIDYLLW
jgi:hypothetical protein